MSDGLTTPTGHADAVPILRVLTPSTTPEEVAAIVAVLSALGSGGTDRPAAGKPVDGWASHRRKLTPVFPHGPGGWRASALPR